MQNLAIGLTNLLIFFTSSIRERALVLEGSTCMQKGLYLPCFGSLILNDSSIVFRVGLPNTPVLETCSRNSPIDRNTSLMLSCSALFTLSTGSMDHDGDCCLVDCPCGSPESPDRPRVLRNRSQPYLLPLVILLSTPVALNRSRRQSYRFVAGYLLYNVEG